MSNFEDTSYVEDIRRWFKDDNFVETMQWGSHNDNDVSQSNGDFELTHRLLYYQGPLFVALQDLRLKIVEARFIKSNTRTPLRFIV